MAVQQFRINGIFLAQKFGQNKFKCKSAGLNSFWFLEQKKSIYEIF